MKIKLTDWIEGMQKVSLTKLQREYFQMSLREAKTNVDRLLDGKEIEIAVESINQTQNFLQEAKQIGVICEIEE